MCENCAIFGHWLLGSFEYSFAISPDFTLRVLISVAVVLLNRGLVYAS